MAETRKEIPFSVIESELHLKPDEVEGFIIDGRFNNEVFDKYLAS